MNTITTDYLNRAELWLLITTLTYFLMNGAQLFETAVLIPKWTSKPPLSLTALQDPYAPDLKTFWIVAHSIHEVTFIAAIYFCWQIQTVRYSLLLIFALHFIVRMWTLGYFAPRIMAFQKVDVTNPPAGIQARVGQWRTLNYIRVGAFMILSVWLVVVYSQARNIKTLDTLTNKHKLMEQRLSVITLGVDNLAAQKEFYRSKIGWEAVVGNKEIRPSKRPRLH